MRVEGRSASAAAAWDPSQITGVAEWWRADLGVTDAGAGAVSAWQGQIAGETVSQGTAGARPTLTTRDSQSVLSLDGGDYLQGAFGTISISQPATVIAVAELASGTGFQFIVDGDDVTNRIILGRNGTVNQWRLFAGADLLDGAINTSPHVHVGVANGASSALYIDNLTSAAASGAGGANTIDGLTVGGAYNGASLWPGYIWEVILVNQAISAGDLALLGAYLDARYAGLSLTY